MANILPKLLSNLKSFFFFVSQLLLFIPKGNPKCFIIKCRKQQKKQVLYIQSNCNTFKHKKHHSQGRLCCGNVLPFYETELNRSLWTFHTASQRNGFNSRAAPHKRLLVSMWKIH